MTGKTDSLAEIRKRHLPDALEERCPSCMETWPCEVATVLEVNGVLATGLAGMGVKVLHYKKRIAELVGNQ